MSRPSQRQGLLDVAEADVDEVVLEGDGAAPARLPPGTFRKVGTAMATLVLATVASYVVPFLAPIRPWLPVDPVPFWNLIGRYALGEGAETAQATEEVDRAQAIARALEDEDLVAPRSDRGSDSKGTAPTPEGEDLEPPERSLEDPTGHALDPFYAALARTEGGMPGAITRVAHYGDSVIGNDGITSAIRRRMQGRFGDAGHGFHLLAPPDTSYRHQGIRFSTNDTWKRCFIIQRCQPDGHYGYGGVTFRSVAGAQSRFRTVDPDKGPVGHTMGRFELWYAAQPGGGRLQLTVDDQEPVVIGTEGAALEDRWHAIDLEDGPHDIKVRSAGGGRLRAYGVVMERKVPGVVWDGLSLIGAFTRRLTHQDPTHFRDQLRHRGVNLVVLTFGGNDMIRAKLTMDEYKDEYREVVALVRAASTDAHPVSCLIMAPVDHGERKGQRITTPPMVEAIVQAQREVAHETGCAFFDTFTAMGGPGSAGRWFRAEPRLMSGDLAHLNHRGHRVVGEYLFRALMEGYVAYRRREG